MMTVAEIKKAIRAAGFRAVDWEITVEQPRNPPVAPCYVWKLWLTEKGFRGETIFLTGDTADGLIETVTRYAKRKADELAASAEEWRKYSDALNRK